MSDFTAGKPLRAFDATTAETVEPDEFREDIGLGPTVVLTDAVTIATNAALSHRFRIVLGDDAGFGGPRTLDKPTNLYDGQQIVWKIKQDGTGGRNLALHADFRFGADVTELALSTDPDKGDYMTAIYDEDDDKLDVVGFVTGY